MKVKDIGDILQRLTNLFPPDSRRKAHIALLKADNADSLPYARGELEFFAQRGTGSLRSEARKVLDNFPS